jgi:hypothetical protein
MASNWLTGEALMKTYCLAAAELGGLCHKGELTAYLPEILKPIYNLGVIQRIPKYAPGTVVSYKHIQSGETVHWDWEVVLGIDKMRSKLREIDRDLFSVARNLIENGASGFYTEMDPQRPGHCIYNSSDPIFKDLNLEDTWVYSVYLRPPWEPEKIVPTQIRELNEQKELLAKNRDELREDIRILTLIPSWARKELGPELTDDEIWREIMPTAYMFLVEEREIEADDLEGQLFFFDYDMFYRQEKSKEPKKDLQEIITAYKAKLAAMWFNRADAEAVLGPLESPSVTPQNFSDEQKKKPDDPKFKSQPSGRASNQTPSQKRPRKPLSVKERQSLLDRAGSKVSDKTIQRWDKGQGTPEGYDGQADAVTFGLWAQRYSQTQRLKKAVRLARTPIPVDPLDDMADDSDMDDDD